MIVLHGQRVIGSISISGIVDNIFLDGDVVTIVIWFIYSDQWGSSQIAGIIWLF